LGKYINRKEDKKKKYEMDEFQWYRTIVYRLKIQNLICNIYSKKTSQKEKNHQLHICFTLKNKLNSFGLKK
tara:strand:+ start:176 stop:388 length:213 start_codon:yes stop_codon:yes gene_type:complete